MRSRSPGPCAFADDAGAAPKSIHRSLPPSFLVGMSLLSVFSPARASCPIFQRAFPLPSSSSSSLSFHFSSAPGPHPLQSSLVSCDPRSDRFLEKRTRTRSVLPNIASALFSSWRERACELFVAVAEKKRACLRGRSNERMRRTRKRRCAALRCRESWRASVRSSEVKPKPFSVFSVHRL